MSTTAAPHLNDRSLVRRLNFLGLPGEHNGSTLTFAELRTELGEQNATSLVIRLGELVKVHHLDQLGVSLDRAVDHILQSLTPDERRSIAAGNAPPPRIEALISAEAEAAKIQDLSRKSREANTDGTGAGVGLAGLDRFAANRALSMRDTDGASSSYSRQAAAAPSSGSILDPVFLKTSGISQGTAATLASMGFITQAQVKALVHDAERLGVDRDKGSIALGGMKSDDPGNYASHVHFFEQYRQARAEIEELNQQIALEKNPARKVALIQKRDTSVKAWDAKANEERSKSESHSKTPKHFDQMKGLIEDSERLRHKLGPQALNNATGAEIAALSKADKAKLEEKSREERLAAERRDDKAQTARTRRLLGDDRDETDRASEPVERHADVGLKDGTALAQIVRERPATEGIKLAGEKAGTEQAVHSATNAVANNKGPDKAVQSAKLEDGNKGAASKPVVQARLGKAAGPTLA